ncbi:MAG: ADP-glyceromanno-heptose 6-epimerase [Opitutae bacterium]|nr:ADP-glyceromanno-heptose 6-epimerase [Opitutae bacterium]
MHNIKEGTTVVTGGAGLIGSATIWGINNQNLDNVWVVDWVEENSPKQRNLASLKYQRFLDAKVFRELVRKNSSEVSEVKTVIHLGACSSTTETNEDYLHDNNFLYTKDVCEWALENNSRFVYASSAATYGDGTMGMDDKEEYIEKFTPLNLYGWSKHKFDLLAKEQGWFDKITGLKYFNVYGPNEEHKENMRSVVSKAYQQIVKTSKMSLFKSHRKEYGDGEQKRDFLYVKDAVQMTLWLVQNDQANGLFNLGNGQARTWLDLGKSIFSALKLKDNIEFVDMPSILRDKYQYFTEAKIEKIKEHGYNYNLFSLEDAVQDYVNNYLVPDLRLGA